MCIRDSLERGRLLERIAYQRQSVAQQLKPLDEAAQRARQFAVLGMGAVQWVQARPWLVVLAVSAVLVIKPRRILPWVERGVALWRGWQAIFRV